MAISVATEALSEIRAILEDHAEARITTEAAINQIRVAVDVHGLDWFGLMPKAEFNRCAIMLLRAFSYSHHCEEREEQLHEGNFAFWIFRADADCCEEHHELDGLALPPEHVMWRQYMPPLGWECGCYVVGARSDKAVARLGGQIGKVPPDWAGSIDPATGSRPGVDRPWWNGKPDLFHLLEAIAERDIP